MTSNDSGNNVKQICVFEIESTVFLEYFAKDSGYW